MSIFPTPAQDKVSIYSPDTKVEMIQILDMTGKLVARNMEAEPFSVNIKDILNGVYIVVAKTESGWIRSKIVINHE